MKKRLKGYCNLVHIYNYPSIKSAMDFNPFYRIAVKRALIIFFFTLVGKSFFSCFWFEDYTLKFFLNNLMIHIPIIGKPLATAFINLGDDIYTKIIITKLINFDQYFGTIALLGALFGSTVLCICEIYNSSTLILNFDGPVEPDLRPQPIEPKPIFEEKKLAPNKDILHPKPKHWTPEPATLDNAQVGENVRVNDGRIGTRWEWGVSFTHVCGPNGPMHIFDPANQTTNYNPNSDNQPLLHNTRCALEDEARKTFGTGNRRLSSNMFDEGQRQFIKDRLQHVNPELARLIDQRGGWYNLHNNREFRRHFPRMRN